MKLCGPSRACCTPVLLQTIACLLLLLDGALCLNYIYDEYMWTKDRWSMFKVESPLQNMNPSDDALSRLDSLRAELRKFKHNSLDGTFPRRKNVKPGSQAGSELDSIDVLEQVDHVSPASKAAQCTVCHAFLTAVWQHVTREIQAHGSPVSTNAQTIRQFEFLCEGEVPSMVLGKYTIHKLQSTVSATSMLFFVIRERKKGQQPTLAEIQAVEMSCKALVSDVALAKDFAVTLADTAKMFRSELDDIRARVAGRDVPPSDFVRKMQSSKVTQQLAAALDFTDVNEDEDEYADEDEDDEGEEDCEDKDARCGMWAEAGECHKNPIYMVGDGVLPGNCRLSCGMCMPKRPGSLPDAYKSELDTVSKVLLMSLRNLGCASGRPCMTGVSGMAFTAGVVNNGEVQAVVASSGFQLGKPYHGEAALRGFNKSERARAAAAQVDVQPPADVATQRAMAAMQDALHGKVVAIPGPPDEYFIYEVAFRQWVQHFHVEEDGEVGEAWHLGSFTAEDYRAGELDMLDLLPQHSMQTKRWPYVRQVYSNGDECKLGDGRVTPRSAEVRIACSPTSSVHMLVREPDFCTYVIVVYIPQLCSVAAYKPQVAPKK